MSRRTPYRKRKRSAREKKRFLYGLIIALIFIISIIAAVFFVILSAP